MRTFLSWKSAGAQLDRSLNRGGIETVSFPFFGGLIDLDVHRQAARRQTVMTLAHRLDQEETPVCAALESAWNLASAVYVSKGLDWEPPVRIVFDRWIRLLSGHKQTDQEITDLAEALVEDEIEFLLAHARPNAALLQVIANVKKDFTRTMVIEDSSFSAQDLRRLSLRADVPDVLDTWLTSAEKGLGKHTGRLFQSLDRKAHLHVGTDPVSDGVRAAEFGIEPWIVYDWRSQYSRHRSGIDKIWWPLESAGPEPTVRSARSAMIRTMHKHPYSEFLKMKLRSLVGK